MSDDHDWAAEFDQGFAQPVSSVEARIWREVYGDEYPEGLGTYSCVHHPNPDASR